MLAAAIEEKFLAFVVTSSKISSLNCDNNESELGFFLLAASGVGFFTVG